MKNLLTGIRPTGNMHIGHYFGTIKNWVELQDKYNSYFEIADVQALTDNFDNPDKVRENVRNLVVDLLSVGIDPNKSVIFLQSQISEIAELTVFYSNLVTMARLYRNPTVKTEIAQKKALFGNDGESVTYGFVGYPVSQAADITAFNGEVIPVGEDQLPLIEQCREIVRKFNNIYGETLTEPVPIIGEHKRIKGLDGNEKMGKSLGNAIYLADTEDEISKKVMSAITDPQKIKKDDPANPDVCMVYYYHKLFNSEDIKNICEECKNGARGCVSCKKQLINTINVALTDFRNKKKYYDTHPEEVDKILEDGCRKAKEISKETIMRVKKNMKIDYFE